MLREANQNDLEDILKIYNDAILHTTAVFAYQPETLANRQIWYEQKMNEGYPIIVYEIDNKVVGFATFGSFRGRSAYKYSVEHSVHVDKEYRKRGIATSLMAKIIAIAKDKDYMNLIAGIEASNDKSIAMHKNLGFVHAGTIKKAGFKFNKWLDLAFYQLELNGPKKPVEE